jgi:hypothetical protein
MLKTINARMAERGAEYQRVTSGGVRVAGTRSVADSPE